MPEPPYQNVEINVPVGVPAVFGVRQSMLSELGQRPATPSVAAAMPTAPINLRANFGNAVWEKDTVKQHTVEADGSHKDTKVTLTPSAGIKDQMWDWLGNEVSDREWATSIGYGRNNKFPDGTPQDVIERASQGVFSFGGNGQVYLTRIDPKHGLDRYEVSEYIAKHGVEGEIALHSDEKTSKQLRNALDGMGSLRGFDKEAGLVLKMEGGVKVRVFEQGGEMHASIVGGKTDADLLSRAERQTPDFIAAADRDWGKLNKAGEVGQRAIDSGFAATLGKPSEDASQVVAEVTGKPKVVGPIA